VRNCFVNGNAWILTILPIVSCFLRVTLNSELLSKDNA
jgi:hypothetical protein